MHMGFLELECRMNDAQYLAFENHDDYSCTWDGSACVSDQGFDAHCATRSERTTCLDQDTKLLTRIENAVIWQTQCWTDVESECAAKGPNCVWYDNGCVPTYDGVRNAINNTGGSDAVAEYAVWGRVTYTKFAGFCQPPPPNAAEWICAIGTKMTNLANRATRASLSQSRRLVAPSTVLPIWTTWRRK